MGTIHRKKDNAWDWEGVEAKAYSKAGKGDITKRILIGPGDGAVNFSMRFFEVPPMRSSADEAHEEQHQVFIMTGKGEVLLNGEWQPFNTGDVVFVPGGEQHCFRNTGDDMLCFICVAEKA